jgi:hypothetical protein
MPAVLTVLVVAAVALLGASSGSAVPLEPEIVLVPDSGAPGDTVEVFGSGFPLFSTVVIGFSQDGEDQTVDFAGTDEAGSFTATVAVPDTAEIGLALFFAENFLVSAEADFLVTESEPIGDTPGPPADKVPVCEVVYILERVVNRVFTTDEDFEIDHPAIGRGGDRGKLEVEAKPREVTRVAEIIARERRPKASFPFKTSLPVLVFVARPEQKRFIAGTANSGEKEIDCPDSVLIEFTEEKETIIELKDQFGQKLGFMELTYRVIVREVQAQ